MRIISSVYDLTDISKPSESLSFLENNLQVKLPGRSKKAKMEYFPINNEAFVKSVIDEAIKQELPSPLHFLFSMHLYYKEKNRRSKDWLSLVNMWLTNGKYDKTKQQEKKIILFYNGNEYTGIWNYQDRMIEVSSDDIVFTDIDSEKMANLVARDKIKLVGVI
jgi:hypothetical protein